MTARFVTPGGHSDVVTTGTAEVRTGTQFPEILEVSVELREVGDISYSPPQSASYHLEVVGRGAVRFRMDSIPLGTVLLGEGTYTARSLVLAYRSPDQRYVGFESFTEIATDQLLASGAFLAEGTLVKTWEVLMERLPRVR